MLIWLEAQRARPWTPALQEVLEPSSNVNSRALPKVVLGERRNERRRVISRAMLLNVRIFQITAPQKLNAVFAHSRAFIFADLFSQRPCWLCGHIHVHAPKRIYVPS